MARGKGTAAENGFWVPEKARWSHLQAHAKQPAIGKMVDDGEPFDEKMKRLAAQLAAQFEESAKLEKAIRENLKKVGYGF